MTMMTMMTTTTTMTMNDDDNDDNDNADHDDPFPKIIVPVAGLKIFKYTANSDFRFNFRKLLVKK